MQEGCRDGRRLQRCKRVAEMEEGYRDGGLRGKNSRRPLNELLPPFYSWWTPKIYFKSAG
ncbi:hypothetical protein AMTR_s00042p00040690 [Amborella trichopoda]|uniref:Uncharacterized protein n=1 Tax=Amborella trichopoda TaxID=13333 RepID=W1P144_AMBTC|nr:hypothetical protein AMTR_s00042p00040690 [Amborella trichopoda]